MGMQMYEQAADAYTALIASPAERDAREVTALHGNRAAAHMALRRFQQAVDDCTVALTQVLGDPL